MLFVIFKVGISFNIVLFNSNIFLVVTQNLRVYLRNWSIFWYFKRYFNIF